jgi:hypothetical protein
MMGAISFDTGRALAGQGGFRRLQPGRLNKPRVGRNGIALLNEDDVARDKLRRWDAMSFADPDHGGARRRQLPQGSHCLLGARLLSMAHDRVQENDSEDGDRFVRQNRVALKQPQSRGDEPGDQQQDDEGIRELGKKLPPCRNGRFRRKFVPAGPFQPQPRLGPT